MSPHLLADAPGVVSADLEVEYESIISEIAQVQGVINLASARLVDLARRADRIGISGGDNLPTAKWLAWRAGIAPDRARDIVRLAERADELPCTLAAVRAGELTVDQAAEVARYVPARFDASAAEVARVCTVAQLRQALPWYRDPKPPEPGSEPSGRHVATGVDARGWWIRGRLPEAQGAVVDQALKAMHEDLRRQARAEAPDGTDPQPVSAADALVAIGETALQAGDAARPGTDRYLVHAHLEAGPDGPQLMTHLGIVLPDGQRRHILCDARLRAMVHDDIAPIGAGRMTRAINRRLRRAIEHRDHGSCTVPGCGRTSGLEIHHIWHWEDGGPTDTANLITLCAHHHHTHHHGTLGIEGNADLPRHREPGVVFTNQWGHPLDPVGQPIRPTPPPTSPPTGTPSAQANHAAATIAIPPHHYTPPLGEPLDRRGFHLQEDLNRPSQDATDPPPDQDPPPPEATGHRPGTVPPAPASPASGTPTDPTRAGPAAA